MNEMRFKKIKIGFSLTVVGILSAVALVAAGQTATPSSSQGNVDGALKDLSTIYGREVSNVTEAKEICNNEKYISDCAEIGKKHNLFPADEIKQVDAVLTELKGKVAEELKNCATEECLVDIATQLAKNLVQKNPTLARSLDLTPIKVDEKKVVVDAARQAGVNIQDCRNMDPDTAPIELLRACARLAKDTKVQKVLSQDVREAVKNADVSLQLREALSTGEVQCGDNTPEGCGNYCLNPGTEARAGGVSAIPQVCRDIAVRFFGAEGVAQLEQAHGQVNQTVEFYKKRAENIVFTTIDGRTITDPAQVGKYLEEEGRKGNVEAVEKGMNFMITKGFLKQEDKEFALQVVGKIKKSGAPVDFDQCAKNPEACREFIPDEHREEFDAFREIENIMKAELGPRGVSDPRQCDSQDQKIGEACLAGAKAALPKLEAIAAKNPQAKFIVQEIKQHIQFGDQGFEARRNVEEKFREGQGITIGGQQFNNFQEVQQFCEKNGQLCLADAAREGFIGKDYAAQKFEKSFETQFRNQPGGFFGQEGGFPGGPGQFPGAPGSFPGGPGGFPQQGGFFPPGGQQFGGPQFQGPGSPGFNKDEALKQFQQWLDNPQGAPPIPYQFGSQQGQVGQPGQQFGPQACPTFPTVNECGAGQRKVVAYSSPQCGVYYRCESGNTTQPVPCQPDQYWNGNTCIRYDGAGPQSCPQGQYWFVPSQGGTGYCRPTTPSDQPQPQVVQCSDGRDNDGDGKTDYPADPSCYGPNDNDEYYPISGTSTNPPSSGSCPSGQFWNGSTCVAGEGEGGRSSECSDGVDNDRDGYTDGQDYGCGGNEGGAGGYSSCDSGLIALLGTGCHSMYTDSSGNQVYCDGPMTKSAKKGATSVTTGCQGSTGGGSWNNKTWNFVDGSSQSSSILGRTDSEYTTYITSTYNNCKGKYFAGWKPGGGDQSNWQEFGIPNCSTTSSTGGGSAGDANSCPGFAYSRWDNSGKRYCQLNSERKCDASYPSYLTNGANYKVENCPADSTGSCPAGQYWYYPSGGGSGYCQSSTTSSSCDSGLIALLGTGCHSMYTDSSGNQVYCDGPMTKSAKKGDSTTSSGCSVSGGTPSCPSGQWWNGSACTSSTTSGTCDSTLTGLLGSGCHNMGNAYFDSAMTRYVLPGTSTVKECSASWISSCTTGGSSTTSCPSGQYWNGSSCVNSSSTGTCPSGQYWYVPPGSTAGYCTSSTTTPPPSSSTCPSFAHDMGGYCMLNNDTSRCASYSSASSEGNYTSSQCTGGTSTSCPSGQWWNGSSCTSSTSGTGCGSYTSQSSCTAVSNCYWYSASSPGYCYYQSGSPSYSQSSYSSTSCGSGYTWNGSSCVSSCPSGQYWNGSACVNTSTTDCPSGQYWNGSSCVTSTTSSGCSTPSTCYDSSVCTSSGWYWYNSGCWSSPQTSTTPPPSTSYTQAAYYTQSSYETTPPPPPAYTESAYYTQSSYAPPPPPPTSFFFFSSKCPSNHYWNGSYCVVRPQYTTHLYAQMVTSLRGVTGFVANLFR
ncbi:MAG: hypothetical protein HYT37_04520 [Candidatus Sungbacteria bacterium]|nr:hypothetical protein [Candidatus Sungbacteria bacterium]